MTTAGLPAAGRPGIVTVTLNPALDHTLECPGFRAGAVNRVVAQALHAGGKGINVAAFLAGWIADPVTATGFLGHDNAHPFDALFRQRGILDRCLRLPGSTRVNIKIVDPTDRQVTDINLPGPAVSADTSARLLEIIDPLAAEAGWFVLAGSLPGGMPPDTYASLVRLVRARGGRIAVDTSGAALRHAVTAGPDLIKPNVHELSELLGRPLADHRAVVAAARDLHDQGIGLVVVSMGAEGAVFAGAGAALLAVPPPVAVASTVGAGDAMVAGTLAALMAGLDLEDCARQGTAFAAGTLERLGPDLPPYDRIKTLMRAVRIESYGSPMMTSIIREP